MGSSRIAERTSHFTRPPSAKHCEKEGDNSIVIVVFDLVDHRE